MKFAICDDEKHFRDQLKMNISVYMEERRLYFDICEFASGEDLLASDKAFDMVFLDYQMSGIDGMDAARELRRRNLSCSIVFVTSYPQFILESFEVQPYRFYIKPISQDQITALLNTFIQQHRLLAPITVVHDGEQTVINVKDILYLEGDGKYCIIRTSNNTYSSSKTLSQVHELLPQHCFYRSHKSYVVNLYSVSSFDGKTATLVNGEIAKISRSQTAEFKRVYMQFVKDYYVKV